MYDLGPVLDELLPARIQCPYCWETIEILVEPEIDLQTYTEDCSVCCHPILLTVALDERCGVRIETAADE